MGLPLARPYSNAFKSSLLYRVSSIQLFNILDELFLNILVLDQYLRSADAQSPANGISSGKVEMVLEHLLLSVQGEKFHISELY